MNENCICIPDSDECFVRKQAYNKAVDDFTGLMKKSAENMFGQNYVDVRTIETIAEKMKIE